MRQNAPLRCAARRWEDRFAILLARQSPAALTGRSEGLGEPKAACGLSSCYESSRKRLQIAVLRWYNVIKNLHVRVKVCAGREDADVKTYKGFAAGNERADHGRF